MDLDGSQKVACGDTLEVGKQSGIVTIRVLSTVHAAVGVRLAFVKEGDQ